MSTAIIEKRLMEIAKGKVTTEVNSLFSSIISAVEQEPEVVNARLPRTEIDTVGRVLLAARNAMIEVKTKAQFEVELQTVLENLPPEEE